MPLFEGWEDVAHTLETIQKQTCRDYRVLISVDGSDTRSHDACQPFLADPRFEIVLQSERLGWAGNMNYLASRFEGDYFCYWQHDDYCASTYLQTLLDYADAHPEAATVYCDMQFSGEQNRVSRTPSETGFALERVLNQAEKPTPAAIRCLIRADALRASMPIQLAVCWVLPLARAGEFHRVPELLYFRNIRKASYGNTLKGEEPMFKWRASMDWSLAVLANIRPLIDERETTRLFAWLTEMLVTNRHSGAAKYNLADAPRKLQVKFVHQLLEESEATQEFRPWPEVAKEDLGSVLLGWVDAGTELSRGEALLMEAVSTRDVLPDTAIETDYVPLPVPNRNAGKQVSKEPAEKAKHSDSLLRRVLGRIGRPQG